MRPFAANSLGQECQLSYRKHLFAYLKCWEAIGEAREVFQDRLLPEVKRHLENNSDSLQESQSILLFSLYMIGKSLKRARPTVMFVSNDKAVRREAFQLIKRSGIMEKYVDFELGHMPLEAEFTDLQLLSDIEMTGLESLPDSDEGNAEIILDSVSLDAIPPRDIFSSLYGPSTALRFWTYKDNDPMKTKFRASGGGLMLFKGRFISLTANHFLEDSLMHNLIATANDNR